jgi:glycosyltransferase involved in cell wall biosynthesis
MKRFLTVFPFASNVHLIKDVGMIPYIMQHHLGYESTLACYKNGNYDYLDTEVQGLKIVFLKKIFRLPMLDVILFLVLNARKYNILQVYHLKRPQLIWCFFFKIFTFGKGKTYLKLDADHRILHYFPSKITKCLLKRIDILSVENKTYFAQLNLSKQFGRQVDYIPNGFYDEGHRQSLALGKKENKIITVGRIGTKQKATEILCKAFAVFSVHNQNWKLDIIGPIEDSFTPFIATYFEQNPHLRERVSFIGSINDRAVLETYYATAKIFALTSSYEGFPLVLAEAARFGCFIIATDLPAVRDLTDNGYYGKLFPIDDDYALAHLFTETSKEQTLLSKLTTAFQSYAYTNFYWPEICKTLDVLLWKK